ncbi:hypothetical protein [Bradyrhizobium sp. CCBAU 25338]|uniref:hypothetical protein n=1 Tax=Bradyrhizobium sp. CCBAU 25338 TaxID=1641877 RepID=UPI0023043917|nr:hypothetical protein [Bradyrhizobium sp. CCBAU 25338]
MAAVYERDVSGTGRGRVVDVALYESVFSLLEGCLPEFSKLGVVRQPSGSTLPMRRWNCSLTYWLTRSE